MRRGKEGGKICITASLQAEPPLWCCRNLGSPSVQTSASWRGARVSHAPPPGLGTCSPPTAKPSPGRSAPSASLKSAQAVYEARIPPFREPSPAPPPKASAAVIPSSDVCLFVFPSRGIYFLMHLGEKEGEGRVYLHALRTARPGREAVAGSEPKCRDQGGERVGGSVEKKNQTHSYVSSSAQRTPRKRCPRCATITCCILRSRVTEKGKQDR